MHLITGLSTGGAERALFNLLDGGLAEHYDSHVISLSNEGTMGPQIQELGVPVTALGMRVGRPSPSGVVKLRRVARMLRPDLIQGWMYHGNLAATLAGTLVPGRPPVVWNVRQSLYDLAAEKPLTRQVIRVNRWLSIRANKIIYNSRVSRQQHEAFGFAKAPGKTLPNGFDVERSRPDPEKGKSVREELSIAQDALVIGHVARFHPMKDHASFLRAAVQVASIVPAVRFLVVGHGVSPQNPSLAGIVPQDLLDRFVFPGERSDINRLMQSMDVLCLSSRSEAFPNVLGEAMACGVPCVTTDVGDSADIVADTGIVVQPLDSEALARGLTAMLEKPDAARRALGRVARKRVEENYSLMSIVEEYDHLYEELHAKRG